ncbi:MAG: CoA transferase [Alphaproteobacteria bacterium]|nr:CoA transferase [Alphaproteobacteria bacterium]
MKGLLEGLRVVEGSAFVAAPLAGMTMAQLGADVIRFDPPRGGLDARRWPLTEQGKSIYWAGLNKGKRSIAVDTRRPEGQEIVSALITAPGPGNGIFLTNFPVTGWLSYETLKQRRADLIMFNLLGNPDGSSAVDYTVNCAVGVPFSTGPEREGGRDPINNALPAWDLATGMMAALGLVAAERHRSRTGEGQLVKLALSDVALAMIGNLGYIGESTINGADRPATGNHLYGAYGSEFRTKDGRYAYVVAITERMWSELVKATGSGESMSIIAKTRGVDLDKSEGARFEARKEITAALKPWFAERTLDDVKAVFAGTGVCWGPYQTVTEMLKEDLRASAANPMLQMIAQPGIGSYLAPATPLDFSAAPRLEPQPAPVLGQHTDEILSGLLGMSDGQIGKLRDGKIVAGPVEL